jgi:hypothetical protein
MADIMSIPSEISFKEMLSHTFPGFFLASSLFMLIDYLSPDNLTIWAMGSLANLVIFGGFIIIIGTILGVIIDGIHHTFIEDDIFDNYRTIHQLKQPISEQLKTNCPSYFENLTRHFFFPKIGNKGSDPIQLEDHLDQAYYRYSEFYSNIFISLIIFSIISPFYIFKVLEISWRLSVLIGIASLFTSCICLISSYTTYKLYLEARSSAICGYIAAGSECTLNCKRKSADGNQESIKNHKRLLLLPLAISIIAGFIIYVLLKPTQYLFVGFALIALIVDIIGIFVVNKYIFYREPDEEKEIIEFLGSIKNRCSKLENHKQDILHLIEYKNDPINNRKKINKISQEVQKYLDQLANRYQITKAKELSNNIKKSIDDLEGLDNKKKPQILEEGKTIINYLEELVNQLKKANELCLNVKAFTDYLTSSDKKIKLDITEKELDIKNCLYNLDNSNQLGKAEEIINKVKELDKNLKEIGSNKKESDSITEILSKSSSFALFSFIISLFAFLIVLFFAYTPINFNVETNNIAFSENIANNTTLKNPVETISLKNLGEELNNVSIKINGIANNWLEIGYVNDKGYLENRSNNLTIASGKTKFIQIKLNSDAMDRKNISQGSYIGSIDIDYINGLKSIPIYINLTKK